MASVNKVILLGTLGRDAEVKYTSSGTAIASLSLATSESWKDKTSGERKEETAWHRVQAFGKLAEIMGEYCKKGNPVYIEGRIKTRSYEKDGVKVYVTEIHADQMQLLGRAEKSEKPASKATAPTDFDDDIPF